MKYKCGECGRKKCRLYRLYNTFLDHQRLYCTACAINDQKLSKRDEENYQRAGLDLYSTTRPHQIGSLVCAVPTEDGETFWGFTSVPEKLVEWWDALPL